MCRNIIRLVAVLFAAFAAAMALPGFYRMIPASWHGDYKKIVYSEILGDFIVSTSIYPDEPSGRSGVRYEIRDSRGNTYTPGQVDTLAVLENASQLIYEGRLPATVCGVAVTPEQVSAHDYTVYFGDGDGLGYGLFDLKDRLSCISDDYRTQDLFRFGRGGIEFLDAPTNRVDTAKTAAFRRALAGAGFVSPASGAWTPADRTDAEMLGYFMTDSRGGFFRMGMCGGEPEVERIALPEGCVVRNLSFVDRSEFLAMMLTEKGEVYRMGRDYAFRRLPLPDTRNMRVALHSMLLFDKFVYAWPDHTVCYVTDADCRMIDSCRVDNRTYGQTAKYRVQQIVFPFSVRLTPWNGLRVSWSDGFLWLLVNSCLTGIVMAIKRRLREPLDDPFAIADLLVVALSGIYGFLGVLAMSGTGGASANRIFK